MISPWRLNRSSPNLPGKWHIGYNGKVKFSVSELFRGWEGSSERSLFGSPSWNQLSQLEQASRNREWRQRGIYLPKKEADWFWPDNFTTTRWKPRENLSTDGRDPLCIFIARQHTDARYWYSNSVCPSVWLSVCLSVRPSVRPSCSDIPWKRLTYCHSFFTTR